MSFKPRPSQGVGTFLRSLDACPEAVEWSRTQRSYYNAWRTCPRGDWLLWIAAELGIDRKLVVRAACACARLALQYAPEGEDQPRRTIETAEAWCDGRATLEEVRAASASASAADAASSASAAAADAASSASAADAAASYADAAYAAAYAADAAADASSDTRAKTLKDCAIEVRRIIPWRVIRDRLENR